MSNNSENPKTLSQALKELEKDSRESLSDQLDALRQTLSNLEPKISAVAKAAVSDSTEHVKKAKVEIEKRVQKNPLLAIGIVAAILLVIGWFLASSKNDDESDKS